MFSEDYKSEKIRAYFLCNVVETCPERRYKLHLTEHDHDTLLALLHDEPLPVDPSPLLVQNFAWFERQLRRLPPADLQALFRGLELLVIVHDRPGRGHRRSAAGIRIPEREGTAVDALRSRAEFHAHGPVAGFAGPDLQPLSPANGETVRRALRAPVPGLRALIPDAAHRGFPGAETGL